MDTPLNCRSIELRNNLLRLEFIDMGTNSLVRRATGRLKCTRRRHCMDMSMVRSNSLDSSYLHMAVVVVGDVVDDNIVWIVWVWVW